MESFHDQWLSLRRGGGGGNDPIARPLSVMLMIMLPLVALAIQQNSMCAAMITGIIFGSCDLDLDPNTALSGEVNYAFIELGMALVFFFAGLADAEFEVMRNYVMPCLKVGFQRLVVITGLFAGIGFAIGLCDGASSTAVFGIACSLSSKKVILKFLEGGAAKTMHGRLLQGMMILQDIVLAAALAVMHAFKSSKIYDSNPPVACNASVCSGVNASISGNVSSAHSANISSVKYRNGFEVFPSTVAHNGATVALEVLRAFGIFTIMLLVISRFKKYHLLEKAFDFFAGDGEMLFIATMSFALGSYALCYELRVSPLTGAYLAGMSLSQTSYKVQIERKIHSLEMFGFTLFYFMLGTYVKLDAQFFRTKFWLAALVALVNLAFTPLSLMFFIYRAGLKSRTALYTSLLCNSMGESTLTLQVIAHQAGVLNTPTVQVLVCATLISILLSNVAHPFLDRIYRHLRPLLAFMDSSSAEELEREGKMPLLSHVVILGYCETGASAADFFRMAHRDVYVVDLNLPFHQLMKQSYKVQPTTKHVCESTSYYTQHAATHNKLLHTTRYYTQQAATHNNSTL
jgi:Kef-type K+ transport system membrane component KefB